jgi:hypothetical protein
MSDRFSEQRINIKSCVKLRKNVTNAYAMLSEAYGVEARQKSGVSEWHKRFKEGLKNVDDDGRRGRHITNENDEKKLRNPVH